MGPARYCWGRSVRKGGLVRLALPLMGLTQVLRAPPPASLGWTQTTGTAAWSESLSIVIPKSKTVTYTYKASPEHLLSTCTYGASPEHLLPPWTVTSARRFKSQKK